MMKSIITTKRFSRFLHLKLNILQCATRVTWQKPATNKKTKETYDNLKVTDELKDIHTTDKVDDKLKKNPFKSAKQCPQENANCTEIRINKFTIYYSHCEDSENTSSSQAAIRKEYGII